ncbi:trimethylamine methyltransferase [Acetohalobium arabaticum DSM 5501]|uniref:Trimethylamine methyltransferase n=1 Tax=Acetohalobium arabaticum (strain ATCC 49924 / DSM 5501 / Z-7288) TaxID=574087 RepID=D9QUA7_ACEAZ|nr:trimethylamine methyltransferase [Acetohalobium arabaticum DSM 5501]
MTYMLPAMAGANVLYGSGMIELGVTFSYTQLMIDNEIARMVRRVINGVEVNDETLATDIMKEVGCGGNFLTQQHTLDLMDQEQSRSDLFDRKMREGWENDGSQGAAEKATERAKTILNDHTPEPLDQEVQDKLSEIVESVK